MMLQPRPGLWLPGLTIMFAVFASQETIPIDTLSPSELGSYKMPSSVGSFIVEAMCFVISGLCVSAAWDAARMHEVAKHLGRREQLVKVCSWILLPCFFWAACAFITLWAYQLILFRSFVYPHPFTILLGAMVGITWSVMGIVFAWLLPRIVALLAAVILPFTITTFAWTLADPRWRHMFGVPSACCTLSATLNTRMVIASMLCLSGLLIVGLALVVYRSGIPVMQAPRKLVCVVGFIGVCGLVSSSYVAGTIDNFGASQPRNIAESVCRGNICFWPETVDAEIEANKIAYEQIRATMPAQWLPQEGVIIGPDRNYRVGVVEGPDLILGDRGAPLLFVNDVDTARIYRLFAWVLTARELGGFTTFGIDEQAWQQWAAAQKKPATPEEVLGWVQAELLRIHETIKNTGQ